MRNDRFPVPVAVYGLLSTRDNRIRFIGQTTGLPEHSMRTQVQKAKDGVTSPVATWCRHEMEAGYRINMRLLVEHGTINETLAEVIASAPRNGWDLLNVHSFRSDTGKDRVRKQPGQKTLLAMKASSTGRKHSDDTKAKISASVRDHARRYVKVALSF